MKLGGGSADPAYASLESFLKPGETRNFSEQDLNAHHGFAWAECDGGNSWISAAYLSRWSGPFNEPEVPYPYSSRATPTTPVKHIQRVQWAPERGTSYTSNDDIKYFLTNYGTAACSYYHNNTYYNATNKAYYYNGTTWSNHMVAVVGWNDTYAASNFNTAPPGNRAFICKNSWGTGWGDNGYFYMSYYDASFGEVTSFNNAESAGNYRGIYRYDPLGWITSLGYSADWYEIWGANIFTAASTDKIGAVGTYATDPNTQITFYVYTNVTAGSPTSGTLAATKVYTAPYSGYYTVKLDTAVAITQGQKFSVVVQYYNTTSPGTRKWLLPFEDRETGYSDLATSNTGESFYKRYSANTWADFYTFGGYPNDCIKAYVGGDCTPNTKDDFVGTLGNGVYYRNSNTGAWVNMRSSASLIIVGDIDGGGKDDLIGIWPSQAGVWVKYSATSTWALLSSSATDIVSGKMRAARLSGGFELMQLAAPMGGHLREPLLGPGAADYSATGPGGKIFALQKEPNLVPVEQGGMMIEKQPGPGEPGFRYVVEKNLVPREQDQSKERGSK